MAILPIVTAPDPRLKQLSAPVMAFDEQLNRLIADMTETMYHDHGVGLAAVQVGVLKQLLVIDLQNDDDHEDRPKNFFPLVLINPVITAKSEDLVSATEGCLSVPDIKTDVVRPNAVEVEYYDQTGQKYTLSQIQTAGWLARVLQHEIDHLNGVTLLQHMSQLKRDIAIRKLKKIKKEL